MKLSSKTKNFSKVAIANRGEVAVRIIRACQELGLESVLLHSEADQKTLAARLADECVCIGPANVNNSYLNINSVIQSALSVGAEALHPGFGFLSENPDFAEQCEDQGLAFIGPSAKSIRLFGDKISAKQLVVATGGPILPGYDGEDQSEEVLLDWVERIGFPVIVKATAGGGGRGLKVIRNLSEARTQIQSAQREGKLAFGSDKVFLEKYLENAKHIEIQIFGDASGNIFHLGERECSVQRRHQKIIEESPAANLIKSLRDKICATAVSIAKQANYQNAGTIEFLVQDNQFYFMEMNTRLQVEHPVTEMVMGIDLVKAQILTRKGECLNWPSNFTPRGHAIECRIYAENPYKNGLPSLGLLGGCHWPMGPGRRFEIGFSPNDEITSHYDSMIAKVIVWDESRPRTIQKMIQTLKETVIFGVHTNIPLLLEILTHPEFMMGDMTTRFFEKNFLYELESPSLGSEEKDLFAQLRRQVSGDTQSSALDSQNSTTRNNPWNYSWSAL
ncbi:MAG: ATP-grasp domain-containing protein [Bdellovibrionales bacterium]|nr:ATP-grasp domain-containing protein [Bdellovibrionales bacterium]